MPSATWPVHVDPDHLYFITTDAVKRAHVFRRDIIKRLLVDSLNTGRILRQYDLYAFVIMPNHIHLILQCLNEHTPSDVVREYKKATASLFLRQYEVEENQAALDFSSRAVKPGQNKTHAIWEADYEAKNVFSRDFLRQKLDYMHNNPLQPQWRFWQSDQRTMCHPRAAFISTQGVPLIPLSDAGVISVIHYRDGFLTQFVCGNRHSTRVVRSRTGLEHSIPCSQWLRDPHLAARTVRSQTGLEHSIPCSQ